MPIKHVLTTDALRYYLHDEYPDRQFPFVSYNQWLRTPPRLYDESVMIIVGLSVKRKQTRWSQIVIQATILLSTYYYPGWNMMTEEFDAVSGEYLGRLASPFGWWSYIGIGRDGSVWAKDRYGNIFQIDPDTGSVLRQLANLTGGPFAMDPQRDLSVKVKAGVTPRSSVSVYTISTGALVRHIPVAGMPTDIFFADENNVYVASSAGILTLVNYVTGETLGVLHTGLSADRARFTFDQFYRRIVVMPFSDDNADGSGTIRAYAYYPVAETVGMSQPIPLRAARKGRSVPVVVELRGGAGELVSGNEVRMTETGPGSISPARRATDGLGMARFSLSCDAAGSQTLNAETTV